MPSMNCQELDHVEGAILNVLHGALAPATPDMIVKSLSEQGIDPESIREAMHCLIESHKVDLTKDWKIVCVELCGAAALQ